MGAGNRTYANVISGTGSLTQNSSGGILTLSGNNTYNGTTTISAGALKAGSGTALGSTANGTTVASGATLDVNGQNLGTEVVTISGTGVGGAGAIVNSGAAASNALGRLVLAADAAIGVAGFRVDLANSTPTLNMAGFTLTKTGTGAFMLSGATVSNPGNIIVNQGTFGLLYGTSLGGSSANSVTVNNSGTLSLFALTIAPAWTLNLNTGSTLSLSTGAQSWSGPVNVSGSTTMQADDVLTINGIISGSGNITKTGTNTLTLNGTNTYSGTTKVTAGVLQLTNNLALQNSVLDTSGNGTVTLSGITTPTFGGLTGSKDIAAVITGNYSAVTALTLNPGTGASYAYSGNITNGASGMTLTKTGNGTQTLSGTNTYNGTTTISAGTLLINGSTSTVSAVTVGSGGTLGGNGTIGGFTTVNGALNPGNSPGVLTFSNGLTLNGTTTMEIVGPSTPGTGFDQVTVTSGTTTFGGALAIAFGPALSLADNTNILLFNFAGTSLGNFSGLTSTGFYNGTWSVGVANNTWTLNQNGQLLTFSEVTGNLNVVPEPATWALLAFSLTTVMVLRRRRQP